MDYILKKEDEDICLGVGFIVSDLIFKDIIEDDCARMSIMFPPEDQVEYIMERYSYDIYKGNEWWNDLVNICKNEKYILASCGDIYSEDDHNLHSLPSPQVCLLYPITFKESGEEISKINKTLLSINKYCKTDFSIYIFSYSSKEIIVNKNGELKAIIKHRNEEDGF